MQTDKIVRYFNDVLHSDVQSANFRGATLDSRNVQKGNIFFAYRGENTNGNEFAQMALDMGAAAVVMDDPKIYEQLDGSKILVKNTLSALREMGRRRLQDSKAVRIVVTGSFGKTSTKDMIYGALAKRMDAYATPLNHNNELGVLLTACGIPDTAKAVVFEVGSNALGEIAAISEIIKPNIGVLTGLGHAHVGKFGGIVKTAYEKMSLAAHLATDGVMVVNEKFKEPLNIAYEGVFGNSVIFGKTEEADVRLIKCEIDGLKLNFTISAYGGEYSGVLNYPYPHLAENFLAAFCVGRQLYVSHNDIMESAKDFTIPAGRGDFIQAGELVIINDTYNASTEAIERGVEALDILDITPKYALIGELAEIEGYETLIYDSIMVTAKKYPRIKFIMSGRGYENYKSEDNITIAADEKTTSEELRGILKGVVLVKAGRSYAFEKYINMLKTGIKNAL